MRIRHQLFINNLFVGIIPLLLTFIVLIAVITIQSEGDIKNNLENVFQSFKSKIEKDTEYFRNYAYLYALNTRFTNNLVRYDLGRIDLNISAYSIHIMEFSRSNEIFFQRSISKEYIPYLISQETVDLLWKQMSSPFYAPNFKVSYPDVASNTLVLRNTAIIHNYETDEKLGLFIIGQPLNTEYLSEIAFGNPDLVLFVETTGGVVFSSKEFQTEKNIKIIKDLVFDEKTPYHTLSFINMGRFYAYKQFLYKVKDEVVAHLGILYGLEGLSKTLNTLRIVSVLLFVFCVLMALMFSLVFSKSIIVPILSLKDLVTQFKTESGVIPMPQYQENEVSELQESFSILSKNIIDYQNKLKEHSFDLNQALSTIRQDLSIARTIQRKMMPFSINGKGDLSFTTKYIPISEVGGDFYDIYEVSEDVYRLFIADATGHGVQAALLTMIIKSEYEKLKTLISEPNELLELMNNEFMTSYYSLAMFFTCIVADMNLKEGRLTVSNAGHPKPILLQNNKIETISTIGNMIGVLKNVHFKNESYKLDKSFKLLLFTDGLTEEFNAAGNEFGEKNLKEQVALYQDKSVKVIIEAVLHSIKEFVGNNVINDDITIIGIEKK